MSCGHEAFADRANEQNPPEGGGATPTAIARRWQGYRAQCDCSASQKGSPSSFLNTRTTLPTPPGKGVCFHSCVYIQLKTSMHTAIHACILHQMSQSPSLVTTEKGLGSILDSPSLWTKRVGICPLDGSLSAKVFQYRHVLKVTYRNFNDVALIPQLASCEIYT